MTKTALPWIVRPEDFKPFLEIKTPKATTKDKSIILPPITSLKESWGMPWKAELIPTEKLETEAAKAIAKKATTNSFHPKNLAILVKEKTSFLLAKAKIKNETIKIITQIEIIRLSFVSTNK